MCNDQWHRNFSLAFDVQKMYPDSVNFCNVVWVLIDLFFHSSSVKLVQPIVGKLFHIRKTGSKLPTRFFDFICPAGMTYSEFQVVDSPLRYMAFEFRYHHYSITLNA